MTTVFTLLNSQFEYICKETIRANDASTRYKDQAALGFHTELDHIKNLGEWLQSGSLAKNPEIHFLEVVEGLDLARPGLATHKDPVLLVTELEYRPGTAETILPHWKSVYEKTRDDESGALLWQLLKDPKDPNKLYVVHAYESRDYLINVHAASKELKEMQAFSKGIQTRVAPIFLRKESGFLYKA